MISVCLPTDTLSQHPLPYWGFSYLGRGVSLLGHSLLQRCTAAPYCCINIQYLFLFLSYFMAPHSSTLAWKIPWTEEPGELQSMGSLRVGHDWATSLSLSCIGEGNGNPLQCSCLENPGDGGPWWAAVYGVAQSWTGLKWLSSSSSSSIPLYVRITSLSIQCIFTLFPV